MPNRLTILEMLEWNAAVLMAGLPFDAWPNGE